MPGITSDLAQKIRRPPAEGLRGVSGRFPPGQHCWATRYVLKKVCTKYVLSEQYYNDTTKCSFRPNLLALNFNQTSVGFAKFVSSQIFIANFKCLLYIRVSIYACKNNYIQLNVTNKKQKWFEDINYF